MIMDNNEREQLENTEYVISRTEEGTRVQTMMWTPANGPTAEGMLFADKLGKALAGYAVILDGMGCTCPVVNVKYHLNAEGTGWHQQVQHDDDCQLAGKSQEIDVEAETIGPLYER